MNRLLGERLPPPLAAKLVALWGPEGWDRFAADPLGTLYSFPESSFVQVDRFAIRQGVDLTFPKRIEMGIRYVLGQLTWEYGHTFVPEDELLQAAARRLFSHHGETTGPEELYGLCQRALATLVADGLVVYDDGAVYPPELYEAECSLAEHLERLLRRRGSLPLTPEQIGAVLDGSEYVRLGADQLKAVYTSLTHPITILTGGPGTGKTTAIAALCYCARAISPAVRIILAAPTGRAARRLAEVTGEEGMTIHRLLEMVPGKGEFRRDEDHPLQGDMIIVDEASMLDTELAAALLRAVPVGMRVVLVGDVAQLPPIGPGDVLRDLMAAGIPTVRLERIFRQHEASAIVHAASRVLEGKLPEPDPDGGFHWLIPRNSQQAAQFVVAAAVSAMESGLPLTSVQVLSPMRRGLVGVDTLNKALQDELNPGPGHGIRQGAECYRVGDKVMCIRNNYAKGPDGIFNGQVGIVRAVEEDLGRLKVEFDGWLVEYTGEEVAELQLAYCMTVHKSQGSEFDHVVLCLMNDHWPMLRRNLLYTAVTRARKKLTLIATRKALLRAVGQVAVQRRYTRLVERLGGDNDWTAAARTSNL